MQKIETLHLKKAGQIMFWPLALSWYLYRENEEYSVDRLHWAIAVIAVIMTDFCLVIAALGTMYSPWYGLGIMPYLTGIVMMIYNREEEDC